MAAPSPACAVLDAETFDLRLAPPTSSRPVRTARDALLSDLDLTTLCGDLSRISRLLALSRTAACAANHLPLAHHVGLLCTTVARLFDSSTAAIAHFHAAATSVLGEVRLNHSLLSARRLPLALHNLESNDHLARALADAAHQLSDRLSAAADGAAGALEEAQTRKAEHEADARRLHARMTELNVRKAAAWHTHGMMLQSLSEASQLYGRAARVERRAARRANVFAVLGFVEHVDRFLQERLGLPVLAPLQAFLEGVRKEASAAGGERQALLEAKKRQRGLNRQALSEVSECSRRILEVKSDADALLAAVEALHAAAGELKRLSVVVMRMAAFWSQLQANMGRLSASELVALVRATAEPELLAEDDAAVDAREAGMERDGEVAGTAAVKAAAEGKDKDEVVDVSEETEAWVPCTAVKRKLVTYYARWVALAEVCGECEAEMVEAKAGIEQSVQQQGRAEVMAPMEAKAQVRRMAADLRREMEEIDAELRRVREQMDQRSQGSMGE